MRAYPTLLDRGDSVSLRVVDNEALQRAGDARRRAPAAADGGGADRRRGSSARSTSGLGSRSLSSQIALADLVADCIEAAVDAVMARYELPWDDGGVRPASSARYATTRRSSLPTRWPWRPTCVAAAEHVCASGPRR